MGNKYEPLRDFLSKQPGPRITLKFSDIDKIIEDALPSSAHQYRPWWGNETDSHRVQARSWRDAGWSVADVDLVRKEVTFEKQA